MEATSPKVGNHPKTQTDAPGTAPNTTTYYEPPQWQTVENDRNQHHQTQ